MLRGAALTVSVTPVWTVSAALSRTGPVESAQGMAVAAAQWPPVPWIGALQLALLSVPKTLRIQKLMEKPTAATGH